MTHIKETEWKWNGTHQRLYGESKALIKQSLHALHFNETRSMCLETGALGVGLGGGLLQIRYGINFPQDRWCASQQHPKTDCICKPKPIKCWKDTAN